MPMLLPRDFHDAWLDPERPGDAALLAAAVEASRGICAETLPIGGRPDPDPALAPEAEPAAAPTLF
jgi:hypothetical protein